MRIWLEHEEPAAYGADVTRRWRLVVACALAIGAGLAADVAGMPVAAAVLFALATILGAVSPLQRAFTAVRSRAIDINVLMVIAVAGAMALGEWLEGASVVFLFAVAQWLEVRTMERARQAIHALIDLSPREAIVRHGAGEQRIPVENVKIGEEIVLRPGDKVPLDGVVVEGHSDVNEAPLTGESLPIDKTAGDEVYAGTINGHGALEVRVTRLVRDTRLSRIIHLVETAQASRAPVQSFVDRFARWYTPAVIVLALGIALVPAMSATADAATWLYRSLVLLVIACPCALVISTPVSVVSALSAAARNGVLIKGGAYLERLAGVRVVAFDKTGTLTKGELQVTDVAAAGPVCARDILRFAAAVESRRNTRSRGPSCSARRRRASMRCVSRRSGRFRAWAPKRTWLGTRSSWAVPGSWPSARPRRRRISTACFRRSPGRGDSIVFVVVDGTLAGAIALADRPRQTAREDGGAAARAWHSPRRDADR